MRSHDPAWFTILSLREMRSPPGRTSMSRRLYMIRSVRNTLPIAALVAAGALGPASAGAQEPANRPLELGIDAAAVFGLGDESSMNISLPAGRMRVGFFNATRQWSIEPALGLNVRKTEGTDAVTTYDLEVGALYHFNPSAATMTSPDMSTVYLRPFVGVTGFSGGDTDDSEVSLGTGLGIKLPFRRDLAWRLEANAGYGFDNEAFRLGVNAGLSFFPR